MWNYRNCLLDWRLVPIGAAAAAVAVSQGFAEGNWCDPHTYLCGIERGAPPDMPESPPSAVLTWMASTVSTSTVMPPHGHIGTGTLSSTLS
jgi:hypothetical protein